MKDIRSNPNLPTYFIEARNELSQFCNENEDKELHTFDVEKTKDFEDGSTRLTIDVVFKK